jgi:transglutaminase-like putative cysteine protease
VVTDDIKAGIEKHIADRVRQDNGYYRLRFGDQELQLKLVRVHIEYLSNLGPRRHFACVDMVSADGGFYDVDFFLAGDPGAMEVTETTVHKLNGRPFYLWRQNADQTWGRAPVEGASQQLLGVVTNRDVFEFRYQATLPTITGSARAWLPVASSDDFQKVRVKSIRAPGKQRILKESAYGNTVLFLELRPGDSGKTIDILYDVERLEKAAYAGNVEEAARYLKPERLVPDNVQVKAIADKAVEGTQDNLMRARALYDRVLDDMRYQKAGEGWGKGDAMHACNARSGNCTDYHAYFIALARAAGIPARFAIGAAIASERDQGGVDGYHCWAEFFAEGKWWPVDISEADKFSALSTYYFGHHSANRLELSRGRDLVVEPGPASGPINFLAYPVIEIEGKPAKAQILFSFRRPVKSMQTSANP